MSPWAGTLRSRSGLALLACRGSQPAVGLQSGWVGSVRTMSDDPKPFNYLWQPGPYPRTQEEREAAARKYGMLVEDYRPRTEDDGLGQGDYPDLANVSAAARSGFYDWDIPDLKRNFGEPMYADHFLYTDTRLDNTTRQRYSRLQYFGIFMGLVMFHWVLLIIGREYPMFQPVSELQIPGPQGKKFYSFDLD